MPIDDDWPGVSSPIFGPATRATAVVPSDSQDLSHICSSLYVGGFGDVRLVTFNFDTVTFVDASGILPIRARRVLASGTTASGILALS